MVKSTFEKLGLNFRHHIGQQLPASISALKTGPHLGSYEVLDAVSITKRDLLSLLGLLNLA